MRYLWASATHTGRVRDHNEDAVWPPDTDADGAELLAAVADGMGGHVGGEVASRLAMAAIVAGEGDVAARVRAANRAILDRVEDRPDLTGMGTTLTLGIFEAGGRLEIGHVGDSRAYLLRDGELAQITKDHSLVAEMVEAGQLHPDDMATHPYRSVITRALGLEREVEVDRHGRDLHPGDWVLLCTDGLTSMLSDDQIAGALAAWDRPPDAAADLIARANAAGGADNVTVVVVNVVDDPQG